MEEYKPPKGLYENLEALYETMGAYSDKATRRTHLTDAQEAALMSKIQGECYYTYRFPF